MRFGFPRAPKVDDDRFASLEQRLSSGLQDQADRFEPSQDSYARLAVAVAEKSPQRPMNRWLAPAAATTMAVAALAVGGLVLNARDSQTVSTGPGGDEVAVSIAGDGDGGDDGSGEEADDSASSQGADTTVVPSTQVPADDQADTGDADAQADDSAEAIEVGPVTGPVRSTRLAAARAFLDLVGLPDNTLVVDGGGVAVISHLEGGVPNPDGEPVAMLSLVAVDDGFAVTGAESDRVAISSVDGDGDQLVIEGSGTGFEATVELDVMSALDNRVLARGSARAGNFGEIEPFRGEVPIIGSERAWVIVSGSGGADRVTEPFAATLASYQGPADERNYAVARVDRNDPDQGLVVRSGPGIENSQLTIIPRGSVGVARGPQYPVPNEAELWWSIVTPDGTEGWVNSRYLAVAEPLAESELAKITSQLQNAPVNLSGLDLTGRVPVAVGPIDSPITVSAAQLGTEAGWSESRSIPLPGEDQGSFDGGLYDYLGVDAWADAEFRPLEASASDADAAQGYFPGLTWVTIVPSGENAPANPVYVFIEPTGSGPEIVGMLRGTSG